MKWSDNSTVSYVKWDGEPDPYSSDENCTAMWVNKYWRVLPCNRELKFVCKRLVEGEIAPEDKPSIEELKAALPEVNMKIVERPTDWTPNRKDDFDFGSPVVREVKSPKEETPLTPPDEFDPYDDFNSARIDDIMNEEAADENIDEPENNPMEVEDLFNQR